MKITNLKHLDFDLTLKSIDFKFLIRKNIFI